MKKVIVFGATGHLGAYTVDYLKDYLESDEYEVIAVGRKDTDFFEKQGITYIQVDVTNPEDFRRLPKKDVHSVICFVGIMPAAMAGYDPQKYVDVNVTGVLRILEYCKENDVDRIMYMQTEADLSGHWRKNVVLKPDLPRKFSYKGNYSLYIITKSTAVDMIESYHQNYGIKRFIFRLPTVYHYRPDPYFYKDGEKKLLAYRQLMEQASNSAPIEMWGDSTLAKDIVYVKDFAQMVYKSILADIDGGIYNVGTGKAVSLEEQITGIVEVFSPKDKPSDIIPRPDKMDSRSFTMDISNAREDLGYEPQYSYLEYLKDFKKEMELNRFAELWEK